MSGLYFKSGIDKGFEKDLARMSQQINQFDSQLGKLSSTINNTFAAVGIGFGLNELAQFGKEVANITGQFQQLSVAFETMLQSKDKADVLMKQAVELASTTPFSLLDVGQGAKQLLAYGFGADQITETLTKLGNVASGLSIPLNDIVYLYGSTLTQGRLYAKDLLQFTTRGIPMVEELAKQFGVSKQEVNDLVSAGKIGFPEVEKAINSMTGETGKFFNLMQKQSQTITGRISNLGDEWDKAYNRLGEANLDFINGVIDAGSYLAQNLETITYVVGTLIATVGTYKASMLIANKLQQQNAIATAANYDLQAKQLATILPLEQQKQLGLITETKNESQLLILVREKLQAQIASLNLAIQTAQINQANAIKEAATNKQAILGINQKLQAQRQAFSAAITERNLEAARAAQFQISNLEQQKQNALNAQKSAQMSIVNSKLAINTAQTEINTIQTRLNTVADNAAATGKQRLTAASIGLSKGMKTLTAAMNLNPIGIISTAMMFALPMLLKFATGTKKVKEEQSATAKASEKYTESLSVQKTLMSDLFKQLEKSNVGSKERKEIIDEINKIQPNHIKGIDLETASIQDLAKAQLLYNDELEKTIALAAKKEASEEINKKLVEYLKTQFKLEKEINNQNKNTSLQDFDVSKINLGTKAQLTDVKMLVEKTKKELTELNEFYDKIINKNTIDNITTKKLTPEELEELRKAENEKLELENQLRINNINEIANLTNKSDKELKKELLENELWYLKEKQKITKNELENAQFKGREIDVKFDLQKLKLTDADMIEALDKAYAIELEKLKQSYKDKKNEQRKFNKESLQLEKANLEGKKKYIQDEETLLKYDNRINEINELIAIEDKAIEQGQQKRLDLIKDANAKILELEKELQADISKDQYEELKKTIDIYKKLLEDLGYIPIKTDTGKSITDTIYGISSSFEGMGDGLSQALQTVTNGILDIVDTFSDKAGATTSEKITSIVSLVVQAFKMIWEAAVSNWDENAQEIDATNSKIAKTIAFEAQINKILRERIKLQREYSAFLDANYKNVYQDAIQQVKDSSKTINKTIGELKGGLTLGATGTGKSLFGLNETSKEFSFTVDEIINGAGETKKKWTRALSGIFDPLDLFGTGANAKAYNDAFEQVKVGFNVALASMGKTAADTANFSTEEWTTFYTLLDEGGFIVDEGTKALVTAMRDSQAAYTEALETMKGVIQDIAGELGNTLGDSIVDSITNGTDAMYEFGKSVNDVLLQLAKAEMNELFFRGLFDNLQSEMNASMQGGDMNWQDDLLRFYNQLPSAVGNAQTFLEGFDEQMKALGFEGVTSSGESDRSRAGQLQQAITEDTASEFVGRLGAIMISNQAIDNKTNDLVYYSIQNLVYQKQIAENTSFLPSIEENTRRINEKL
jgi:tape measure domain-containing protein